MDKKDILFGIIPDIKKKLSSVIPNQNAKLNENVDPNKNHNQQNEYFLNQIDDIRTNIEYNINSDPTYKNSNDYKIITEKLNIILSTLYNNNENNTTDNTTDNNTTDNDNENNTTDNNTTDNNNENISTDNNENNDIFKIDLNLDKLYKEIQDNINTINNILSAYKNNKNDIGYESDNEMENEELYEIKKDIKGGENDFIKAVNLASFSLTCVFIAIIIILIILLLNKLYKLYYRKKQKKKEYRLKRKARRNEKIIPNNTINDGINIKKPKNKILNIFNGSFNSGSSSSDSNSSDSNSSSENEYERIDIPKNLNIPNYDIYKPNYTNTENPGAYSSYYNGKPVINYYFDNYNSFSTTQT
jgi:hypothetical protein